MNDPEPRIFILGQCLDENLLQRMGGFYLDGANDKMYIIARTYGWGGIWNVRQMLKEVPFIM